MLLLADTGKPGGPARPWAKWKCVLLIQKCIGCKKKKKWCNILCFPIILWLGDSLFKFLWKTCGKIYMEKDDKNSTLLFEETHCVHTCKVASVVSDSLQPYGQ